MELVKTFQLMLTVAPLALATPAMAQDNSTSQAPAFEAGSQPADAASSTNAADREVFGTGVAKGRDVLDLAISTSSLKEEAIERLAARTLAEIFHNIPGVRAEVGFGDGNSNITIRGLPMASTGAKFLQLQENGLPVVEFGDMVEEGADQFIRYDLNVAQIEAIRGGSSSTFASNSPGGVINLIDKTGEVEGGSVMASTGLDYGVGRIDASYGGKLSDTLRFHVGGFYRRGEGQRRSGYAAFNGGQVKFNVTKTFDAGYIRLYGKYLNDSTPFYEVVPMRITGTDANPTYSDIANFAANRDTLLSKFNTRNLTLDENNTPVTRDIRKGQHSVVKSAGLEFKIDLAGWTITERFRYSDIGGTFFDLFPIVTGSASEVADSIGGPGARLSFARGPNAGQAIANPDALNGNGLASLLVTGDNRIRDFSNITNDIRASRVWRVGGGDLTTTAGFYASRQKVSAFKTYNLLAIEVAGGGQAAPLDISAADGTPVSQDGYLSFGAADFGLPSVAYDVVYQTKAAFGSLNYRFGRVSLGASVRYDFGDAKGRFIGGFVSAPSSAAIDMNGDGVISQVEQNVGTLPTGAGSPVGYDYNYFSYSTGATYRLAESTALFARYSRGARANSDRLLGSSAIDPVTGNLLDREAVVDFVRQAEGGVKYRQGALTLNLTGFLANTTEHNFFFGPKIDRKYRTYGLEFEGAYRMGVFNLNAGLTYTVAKIVADATDPTVEGNKPLGQPTVFGFVAPSIQTERFSLGANIYGLTSRFASDTEQLKLPGYVLVNPFIQYRPMDRLQVSLNANNIFNINGVSLAPVAPTIPANNIASVQALNGRTILASVRFDF